MADSCEPNFTSVRAFILPNITSIPHRNTVEVYTLTFLSKKSCIKIVQGATQDKKTENYGVQKCASARHDDTCIACTAQILTKSIGAFKKKYHFSRGKDFYFSSGIQTPAKVEVNSKHLGPAFIQEV